MKSKISATPWFIRQPNMKGNLRLYCFSYAGGNPMNYLSWQEGLSASIEMCAIQLPGRGARLMESSYCVWSTLIEDLAQALFELDKNSLPFAFFGHSLGALIAFELVRYSKRHRLPMPIHLFVSGCAAPQHRSPSLNLHKKSDDKLIETLTSYNGTPPEILENCELMELVLPAIRSDFALSENYKYIPDMILELPITVLAGKCDSRISPEQVDGWKKETADSCRPYWFDGDHFFINPERTNVLNLINLIMLSTTVDCY